MDIHVHCDAHTQANTHLADEICPAACSVAFLIIMHLTLSQLLLLTASASVLHAALGLPSKSSYLLP